MTMCDPHGGESGESRVGTVARWFGLSAHSAASACAGAGRPRPCRELLPDGGQILLITGPSGAGKSTLLRRLSRMLRGRVIHLEWVRLPNRPVIELFDALALEEALGLLSRLGLAEAHMYLLRPRQLSTGQRWRLRLALAVAQARGREAETCIVCDEFAATLDRVTAMVVAHALRRMVDSKSRVRAILATSREDLGGALRPDRVIRCDFGLDGISEI